VVADLQGLERSDRDLGYGADIGSRFTPDYDPLSHVSEFLSLIGQRNNHLCEPLMKTFKNKHNLHSILKYKQNQKAVHIRLH
jgi:hypothetical protein